MERRSVGSSQMVCSSSMSVRVRRDSMRCLKSLAVLLVVRLVRELRLRSGSAMLVELGLSSIGVICNLE